MPYTTINNTELFILLRNTAHGDVHAFEKLRDMMYDPLRKMAIKRFGSKARPQDVDDIVAEIFSTIWEKANQFRGSSEESARGWIFILASNRCWDILRSNQRRNMHEVDQPLDDSRTILLQENGHSPVSKILAKELLGRLTAKQREIVIGKLLYGHTFEEMAEMGGESTDALKNRYYRALENMYTDATTPVHTTWSQATSPDRSSNSGKTRKK